MCRGLCFYCGQTTQALGGVKTVCSSRSPSFVCRNLRVRHRRVGCLWFNSLPVKQYQYHTQLNPGGLFIWHSTEDKALAVLVRANITIIVAHTYLVCSDLNNCWLSVCLTRPYEILAELHSNMLMLLGTFVRPHNMIKAAQNTISTC